MATWATVNKSIPKRVKQKKSLDYAAAAAALGHHIAPKGNSNTTIHVFLALY
jgi:hypothetical protein